MIQAGRDGGRYRNDPTARTPDELAATTTKPELGVEAMSLYTHVRNKGDLLDGMVAWPDFRAADGASPSPSSTR